MVLHDPGAASQKPLGFRPVQAGLIGESTCLIGEFEVGRLCGRKGVGNDRRDQPSDEYAGEHQGY